jgi:hypothetical protein
VSAGLPLPSPVIQGSSIKAAVQSQRNSSQFAAGREENAAGIDARTT